MNNNAVDFNSKDDVSAWLRRIFDAQYISFQNNPFPSASARKSKINLLRCQLRRYQDLLSDAMSTDFGLRSHTESKLFDILGSMLELNHLFSHVGKWMKPSYRKTELLFKSNSLKVVYQPKGVVGIIVPWNFPIYLAIGPLAAAIAAGNRVMIKMPEAASNTGRVLAKMLAEIFPEDEVSVIYQKLPSYDSFTSLPFNHIVFTGSPSVGKSIMRSAAENLTPITLELGGKSPAIVGQFYSIDDAARRIVHGKTSNCGQICVAPDYAIVPRERLPEFVSFVKESFEQLVGGKYASNPSYTSIVNEKQRQRIRGILTDAIEKGATVIPCAEYSFDSDHRRMPLHIVLDCSSDMLITQQEIFGPLLPVLTYDELEEVVFYLKERPVPLALYLFSNDKTEQDYIISRTNSGGVTINDWGWHVVNHDAPFGGSGNSGMGTYHGVEGFRELSHARTIFKRHRFFPTHIFHPPYGKLLQNIALKFFLGKADASLNISHENGEF